MVCAPKYVAGVRVNLDVYYLRVVRTADVAEGAVLGSDGAIKCGDHGVGVLIVHGSDVICVGGGRVAFLMWYDV